MNCWCKKENKGHLMQKKLCCFPEFDVQQKLSLSLKIFYFCFQTACATGTANARWAKSLATNLATITRREIIVIDAPKDISDFRSMGENANVSFIELFWSTWTKIGELEDGLPVDNRDFKIKFFRIFLLELLLFTYHIKSNYNIC